MHGIEGRAIEAAQEACAKFVIRKFCRGHSLSRSHSDDPLAQVHSCSPATRPQSIAFLLGSRRHIAPRKCDMSMQTSGSTVFAAVVATAFVIISVGSLSSWAQEIAYLGPPGEPAEAFARPQRPVADIVSPSRSTEQQRDAFNESGQVAGFLGLKPGMTVGDIGAGSGYHTVRLSHLLGTGGQVIAQDVIKDYLIQLARRTKRLKLSNVKFALGEPHDPRLPRASLDAAILVHMYHEVDQPYAFLYNLVPALRSGARVGFVDFDRPTSQHGTPLALLACELAAVGYREISVHQLGGDLGYLAIFSPPAEVDRKSPGEITPCSTRR